MVKDRGEPIGERNGIPIYRRPQRRTPLGSRQPRPRKVAKTTALRASERVLAASQKLVARRSRGTCERCLTASAEQFHHRCPRGAGGSARNPWINLPSNLLHLCRICHSWVEANRMAAYLLGLLVHRGQTPAETAVTLGLEPFSHRFLLDDDGGMTVVEKAA